MFITRGDPMLCCLVRGLGREPDLELLPEGAHVLMYVPLRCLANPAYFQWLTARVTGEVR